MVDFIAALPGRARAALFTGPMHRRLGALAGDTTLTVLFFLGLALCLRGFTLGSPTIQVDEQFYLLVGDRMLHGALPFVDIWDRKPVGLFLLFAAIRLLGGEGILQYQWVALLSVTATSVVIWRTARMIATPAGALCAGVAYQLFLSVFFCFGGQSPVYYNLPVALTGLWMAHLMVERRSPRALFWHGMGVMLVVGLALQIKYTVMFEGIGFGLALMWRAHSLGWKRPAVLMAALAWCVAALLPTAAALAYYARLGYADTFIQANFLSIFGRNVSQLEALWRLTKETLALIPFWLALFLAPRRLGPHMLTQGGEAPQALPFLRLWGVAAFGGFLLLGTWYDHYLGPVMVPFSILAAPALGRAAPHRWYTRLLLGFGAVAALGVTAVNMHNHGSRADVDALIDQIEAVKGNGCLYVAEGDPILYHLSHSCLPSRYAFPNHLTGLTDSQSLGVDAQAEARHIMDRLPSVVVITAQPEAYPVNWPVRNFLMERLGRDYALYGKARLGTRDFLVYQSKALSGQHHVAAR
ncbi:MAG: glycosyltransferase family 39 protein [Sphingomonadales bacterium]|nr:glycosyltransferase family 39 protein [Sphingomonadales bacterium]MDE2168006.1 glycosyltransferase family 39 protein [Sphingomonadales bacterium]